MADAVELRHAVPADIDGVAALIIPRAGGDSATWRRRLRNDLDQPDRALWVAADLGQVIAYGRVHRFRSGPDVPPATAPDGYYLIGLGVLPQYRRHGIGRAITQARLSWIAERATEAWYFTSRINNASRRLHHELGFREVTRDFMYPGVQFDGGVGILCSVRLSDEKRRGR